MSKLPLRRKPEMPVPHEERGTFFLVKALRSQEGMETQRSCAATP